MYGIAAAVGSTSDLTMLGDLGLAMALSTLVGVERELRAKSAGMRTHTLVGIGAALFLLVSKYGFADVLHAGEVTLDPSRVAAQIVSGIGFIGGGLIFVRRDVVRGLTTAASVWLVAGIGMASGAGLVALAVAATAAHFVVALGYAPLENLVYRARGGPRTLRLTYREGAGVLRRAMEMCTGAGLTVVDLRAEREDVEDGEPVVSVWLHVRGKQSLNPVVAELSGLPGLLRVSTGVDPDSEPDTP